MKIEVRHPYEIGGNKKPVERLRFWVDKYDREYVEMYMYNFETGRYDIVKSPIVMFDKQELEDLRNLAYIEKVLREDKTMVNCIESWDHSGKSVKEIVELIECEYSCLD